MNAAETIDFIEGSIDGELPSKFSLYGLINRAAISLEAERDWKYLIRTTRSLAFRVGVSGDLASFTAATKTLTLVGAFASYTLVPGDFVTLTLNAVEAGTFQIVSRVSDDAITLSADSITSDYVANVTFVLDTSRVAMPSEVGRIMKVYGENSFNNSAFASTVSELTELDSRSLASSNFVTGYDVEWNSLTPKSAPVQTLRIWSEQAAAQPSALHAVHLRSWPTINAPDDILPLPPYMESLYLEYVQAYVLAYDETESLGAHLQGVRDGGTFKTAASYDIRTNPQMGKPRNRAISPIGRGVFIDPLGHPVTYMTLD